VKMRASNYRHGERGFTLLEMMVVIAIMLILLSIAAPVYSSSLNAAREDNLRKNLETINRVIVQYTLDKKKAPQSLGDLVSAKYLEEIPKDITDREDTWVPESDESTIMALDQDGTGIIGVHSGSDRIGSDGTAYSEW